MIGQEAFNLLTQLMWMTPRDRVFVVLDGASVPGLLDQLYADPRPEFECLYREELEPDVAEVAPYLVALERGSAFAEWVITQGWGNHWGIFIVAPIDLRGLRFHLRPLNIAYDPAGDPKMFRYYDPRVLRTFLPTCDAGQIGEMFGPIERFVAEDGLPQNALTFTRAGNELQTGTRRIARST